MFLQVLCHSIFAETALNLKPWTKSWREPLSHHLEPCKAQKQLLFAYVAEADGGLHIVTSALYAEYITDAETLVFDDLSCA